MAIRKLETMSGWISVGTKFKIEELKHYINTLKKQLDNMMDEYETRMKAIADAIEDEKERDDFNEWYIDDYWRYKETIPRILLNSFHVTAYSLLESEIRSLASRVGKNEKQIFDVSDIRGGDYLESASYYIEKLTGTNAKNFSSWMRLKEGQRLRNIIIHSNGRITEKKDIDLVKKYNILCTSNIEVRSGRRIKEISITYEYCRAFLDILWAFFDEIYKEMKAGSFL
ncbi:hypothetical protein KA005_83405 [bacterium]|nr:hypothetical protein [bacterium]